MKNLTGLVLCLAVPSCAVLPNTVRVETEHVSHLTAGWPFDAQHGAEDALYTLSVVGRWQTRGAYLELGEGVNLAGRNGKGFYGPAEVFTARLGYEFRVR
jgi:hypothetical protein